MLLLRYPILHDTFSGSVADPQRCDTCLVSQGFLGSTMIEEQLLTDWNHAITGDLQCWVFSVVDTFITLKQRQSWSHILGSVFGRTNFCGFSFWSRRFFCGFRRRIYAPPGKRCPENPPKFVKHKSTYVQRGVFVRFHSLERAVAGLLEFIKHTVGTKIVADPEICIKKWSSELCWFYCGIGLAWNKLSFPAIFWLCSSCRTDDWNQSESLYR